MDQEPIRILLLSETEHGCSNLRRLLEHRGHRCYFGSSFIEAETLFEQRSFHLVISAIPFQQYDRLLAKLSALPATVFQCFLVEDGCWWLPVARKGQACLGEPALRPDEFMGTVNLIVEEIRAERAAASGTAAARARASRARA